MCGPDLKLVSSSIRDTVAPCTHTWPAYTSRSRSQGPPPTRRSSKHFYNEADPARALGMLEEEMQGSTLGGAGGVVLPTCCEDLIARLRCLLEEECEAQVRDVGN